MKTLTSARNPLIKEIRKAILRGSMTEQGYCVAEGVHLLEEALQSGCEIGAVLVRASSLAALEERMGNLPELAVVPDALFREIATTETTQGVIALVKVRTRQADQVFAGIALVPILDGIQDPGNAGAILRGAEAFGATGVVFLKGSVNPYNPKALRASAGSIFRVPVAFMDEREIPPALDLYALMPDAPMQLGECRLDRSCGIVVGSEGRGVNQSLQQRAIAVRIPTLGVESLNAAMAATVALYEARRQRG